MKYDFITQLKRGHEGEAFLDALFGEEFLIVEPRGAQRSGYDRLFQPRDHSRASFTVEYKTDQTAARTNNAFVETVSVDSAGKIGWALTSQADYLAYYIPDPLALVYMVPFGDLRARLERWQSEYPMRSVRNDGYLTKGLLVPLAEFEEIAEAVIDVSCEEGRQP